LSLPERTNYIRIYGYPTARKGQRAGLLSEGENFEGGMASTAEEHSDGGRE